MTTRQAICSELSARAYPQTSEMLREKIGKSTVQLLCRCLALEDVIVEKRIRGQLWYAARFEQFSRRPYRLEYATGAGRGHQWRIDFWYPSERGARAHCAHFMHNNPDVPIRLVCGERVIQEWNTPEIQSWLEGKQTLLQIKRTLRSPSRSRNAASTPEQTSPQ